MGGVCSIAIQLLGIADLVIAVSIGTIYSSELPIRSAFPCILLVGVYASCDDDHVNHNNNNNDYCSAMNVILGTRSFTEGTECDDTIIEPQ